MKKLYYETVNLHCLFDTDQCVILYNDIRVNESVSSLVGTLFFQQCHLVKFHCTVWAQNKLANRDHLGPKKLTRFEVSL